MQLAKHDAEVRLTSSAHMYQQGVDPNVVAAVTDSNLHVLSRPHALTPSRPHALTPSRPHALTPSRPHALTPSRPHTLTPSHPHTLQKCLDTRAPFNHSTNLFKNAYKCMCPNQCTKHRCSADTRGVQTTTHGRCLITAHLLIGMS